MNTAKLKNKIIHVFYSLISALILGCQPPIQISKGVVVNKTNPNFLENAGVDTKTNPHKNERCFVCHKISKNLLTKEIATENEIYKKRLMNTDMMDLCNSCHKTTAESRHPVGVPANINKESLPLDHQGNITCANTCHHVHTKDTPLIKKMIRRPFNALCLSCHEP